MMASRTITITIGFILLMNPFNQAVVRQVVGTRPLSLQSRIQPILTQILMMVNRQTIAEIRARLMRSGYIILYLVGSLCSYVISILFLKPSPAIPNRHIPHNPKYTVNTTSLMLICFKYSTGSVTGQPILVPSSTHPAQNTRESDTNKAINAITNATNAITQVIPILVLVYFRVSSGCIQQQTIN